MPTCPVGFDPSPTNANACVAQCPTASGFELRMVSGIPSCVYTADPSVSYTLQLMNAVADVSGGPPRVDQLPLPSRLQYMNAQIAADSKKAIALSGIGRAKQESDAFKALQAAENARDTAPQAYQDARIRYYTLTKGDEWVRAERTRLLNAEVLPQVASYIQSINDVTERKAQQETTQSVVGSVKSKLISLKDDFRITTNTLAKQVDALKSQIEIEKRQASTQVQQTSEWFINLILIVLSLIVIGILVRKLMTKMSSSPNPSVIPPR